MFYELSQVQILVGLRVCLGGVCTFSSWLCGFSLETSVFHTVQKHDLSSNTSLALNFHLHF